jgi:RNA polymerase sigma-70 factor (ECF subfamily)
MQDSILELPLRNIAAKPEAADARGFDVFLREHYHVLLRFLRGRTASEQDAEDAAQESLARLLRYRETQPTESWKPLLFRIAANVAHDQSRHALSHHRKAHVSLDDGAFEALAVDTLSPERRLADERQLALVLQAIRRLPDKCRHVFLLSRFHGMSNHDIAIRCGISVRMVEKQITKALATCRTTVRDYGA